MADAVVAVELAGLALPASKTSPGGYFQSKSKYDVAWGDLLLALFVPAGSRVMRRRLGSSILEMLFEPLDSQLDQQEISFRVRDAIRQQAPHIRIERVQILDPQNPKTLSIAITFSLREDPQTDTRRIRLSRNFISAIAQN